MKNIFVTFVNLFFIIAQVSPCSEMSEIQIIKNCSISDRMFYDVWYYDDYCYIVVEDPMHSGVSEVIYPDCSLFVFHCENNNWKLVLKDSFYRNAKLCDGTKNVICVDIFKHNDDIDEGLVGLYYLNKGKIQPIDEYDFSFFNSIDQFKMAGTGDVIGQFCQIKDVSVDGNKVKYTLIRDELYFSEIKDEVTFSVPLFMEVGCKFYHSDTIQVVKEIK